MKAIWTKSKPEYRGELVKFDPMMTWPKPVQKPHPPILVGGAFPTAPGGLLRYGDGWMPHRSRPKYANVRPPAQLPADGGRGQLRPRHRAGDNLGAKEDEDMLEARPGDEGVVRDRQPRVG
jgi:alkanesulfonate monooxygenase SsuD/methylene tetrahydromethanopterin reductase-like flavin-dependent oxidoreductase (luciferase family)